MPAAQPAKYAWLRRLYRTSVEPLPQSRRVLVVVVGSERGLCGGFNAAVAGWAGRHLERCAADGVVVELVTLGSRVERLLERGSHPVTQRVPLPVTALPPFALAADFTRTWLLRYEEGTLDGVDLVYNAYRGVGRYEPTVTRLVPPEAPPAVTEGDDPLWPPTIVETDPLALYARVVEQWTALNFYTLLLDSAMAEHSTRYQLMESATQNAERLIEELTLETQAIRRQAITREMQELAVGAGLVGPR